MAIPYPPDGRVSYSQDMDHRVGIATRVILEVIDEHPGWDLLTGRLASRLGLNLEIAKDRALVQDAFVKAELDLEWTNEIVYENDHFRRPGGLRDPVPVRPERLRDVAE